MDRPRVAIVGASGIGQHHARWYHLAGAEVVAFAGTSEASCTATSARLTESFGFAGRWYWDVEKMLRQEAPCIVAVCSPPPFHLEHVLASLDAGAHVLCEKPLVCDLTRDPQSWIEDGRTLVEGASAAGRYLGMTAQVAAAVPYYRQVYAMEKGHQDPCRVFFGEFQNKARKGRKQYEDLWCDVSPHLLGLLMELLPGGEVDPPSLRARIDRHKSTAEFDWVSPSGRCSTTISLVDLEEGTPVRRFGINGIVADWEGYRDDRGVYRSLLRYGEHQVRSDDFLSIVVADFVALVRGTGGRIWVDGPTALRNLDVQVQTLLAARVKG